MKFKLIDLVTQEEYLIEAENRTKAMEYALKKTNYALREAEGKEA